MARRSIEIDGVRWLAEPSGRATQYGRDELGLVFRQADAPEAERRYIRFSPRTVGARELAFARLTDAELIGLARRAQPARTSPDAAYGR